MHLIVVSSGAAALVYEVLWLRVLTLSMGHTTGAVGTVLAAFMGGLAAGAWGGGRVAHGLSRAGALRAYGWLEIAVAIVAIALPFAWALLQPVLAWAYADAAGGARFDVVRVVLALALIAAPAAAMGATYPLAVRAAGTASGAGRVYAANTAGAALGVLLGGFVLLPAFGQHGTTAAGVLLNAAAALLAFRAARAMPRDAPATDDRARVRPPVPARIALPAAALAVSGFVALVHEVAWTRILAMVLGPTTYAFSAMLLAFITGLAIGSAVAAGLAPRTRHPGRWLALTLIAAAAAALAASVAVDRLPLVMAAAVTRPDTTFDAVLALQVVLGIAVQLPMTIALGAAFPLAVAYAAPAPEAAPRAASVIYAANTVGAIAGALAGSFLLVPTLGLQLTVRTSVVITIAAGAAIGWTALTSHRGRAVLATLCLIVALGALLLPPWNQERLANGGYRYAPALAAGGVDAGLEAGELLFYREGASGTVSVRELPGVRAMAIDGKVDASNAEDMLTQKLLAHVPLLLHPNPRQVLVVGLGSGVTLGAALTHPIARADVLEISSEVAAASKLFANENRSALDDPRTRLVLGDGRSHVLLARRRYDVIVSEPSNPWMAGVSALFTREFFAAARERLAPGGILCQWAHTYNISPDDLRSIVATFLAEFPDGSAWLVGDSDLLLIGSPQPIPALFHGFGDAWLRSGVVDDLRSVGIHDPYSVLSLFLADAGYLAPYAAGARIQDDARLALEFTAPRAVYGRFQRKNVERLREVAARAVLPRAIAHAEIEVTPAQWRNRGLMRLRAGAADLAFDDLRNAVEGDPADRDALDGLVRAAVAADRLADADERLRLLGVTSRRASVHLARSSVLAARGRLEDAANAAREAARLEPNDGGALRQLAAMYADLGDAAALEQLARIVEPVPQHRSVGVYARARMAHLQGDLAGAVRHAERLARLESTADAFNLLGTLRAAGGEYDAARDALQMSLRRSPRDAVVLANLGTIELRAGNAARAIDRFAEALFVQPTMSAALDGLAEARQAGTRDPR